MKTRMDSSLSRKANPYLVVFTCLVLALGGAKAQVIQDNLLDAATKNMLAGMSGTRREVAEIVIKTVNNEGVRIIGVGSWISGGKYIDPLKNGTSDHDLRLIMENVGETEAIARWNTIRGELIQQVRARFGSNAQKVLESINLYPPEVVLEGIDDADDALQKLEKLNMNPNLGNAVTEGLWGKGAKAFRDTYEKKSGRVFWKEGGKVASGFADLLPLGETSGIYTIEGSANIASQFADKTADALKKDDAKTVRKNLHRLSESLKKSRDLARLQKANYLDDIIKKLDNYGDDLEALKKELVNPETRQTIDRLLNKAKMDAELLKNFATNSHPRNFTILKEMLEEGTGRWSRVKSTFLQANAHIPWSPLLKGFLVYINYLQVKDISQNLGSGEQEKVLQGLLTEAGFVVSIPAGILTQLVSSIIEDAKEAGYLFVVQFQDCEDLIAGLYEVKGREDATPNQKIETNIDKLAKEFTEESQITPIVALHARNAASRGIDGKVTQKVDAEVEKKLNEKCGPEIIEKWQNRRADLIGEAAEMIYQIEGRMNTTDMIGVVNPSRIVLQNNQASAVASVRFNLNALNESKQIQNYINAISLLGGKQKIVAVSVKHSYHWIQDGKEIAFNEENFLATKPIFNPSLATKTLIFKSSGQHTAQLEYRLEIDITTIAKDVLIVKNKLTKNFIKTAIFFVEVVDKEEATEEVSQPVEPSSPPKPGTLSLNVPKEVLATELVDVKLTVPAELQRKITRYSWNNNCSESPNSSSAKVQFRNPLSGKPQQNNIYVSGYDANNSAIASISENIIVKPVFFSGSASDVWEGGSNSYGLELTRKPAIRKREAINSATVSGSISIKWADSFAPKTPEEIQKELNRRKGNDQDKTITAITIGDFKGYILETNGVRQGFTGSGFVDAGYPDAGANGFGYAIKGCLAIEFSYSAGGSGNLFGEGTGFGKTEQAWWNDIPFLLSQTKSAATEAKSILAGLSLKPDGNIAKTPYKGPKLDGSDLASVRLVVSPNIKKLKKGDIVNVKAVIENEQNAEKPIEFSWVGDHAGSGANVKFLANKPGKQSLSLTVKGVGAASVEFEVADMKAEIVQMFPSTPKVVVGSPVSFSARLLSEGKPVSGNYIYRWQPTPEENFEPIESPTNQTKVIFSRPGTTKVWVQILEKKDAMLETVAESEQISIEVLKPEFNITFNPARILVGNQLKVNVTTIPADLKEVDFRWEISANARQTLESPDKREVTLIPLDTKPISVTVRARVPFKGDDLGEKNESITAQKYDVKVNVLGTEGPKPMVWKQGVGLVPLENGIAIHQFVGLAVDISPQVENIRYEWALNEDSHFESNSISRQIRVSRSQVGTCTATVVVRDANGVELGQASGNFEVTVSQEELDKGTKMAASTEKLTQAKALIQKGLLDEAITSITEYLAINPKNAEALALSKTWKADKATILTQLEKVRVLLNQSKFDEAEQQLLVAQHLHLLYKPVLEADSELKAKRAKNNSAVAEGLGQARLANEAKQFKKTIEIGANLRKNYQLTAAAEAELQRYEDWARPLEIEKERRRGLIKQAQAKLNAGDFDGAIKDIEEMWKNFDVYWSHTNDPEPKITSNINSEAFRRRELVNTLMPQIKQVVENQTFDKIQVQEALRKVDEVLQVQSNNTDAQYYKKTLAERLTKGDSVDKASTPSATSVAKSEALIKEGDALHNQKKYGEAVAAFTQAIALTPNAVDAWRLRGRSKRDLKDYEGAISDYTKAISLEPNSSSSYNGRGWTKELSGDSNGALSDLTQAIQLNSTNESAFFNRAFVRYNQKNYTGSIADYDQVIALNPKNINAYLNRGLAKEQLKNSTGAINDFEKVLAIEPANEKARLNLERLKGALAKPLSDNSTSNTGNAKEVITNSGKTSWGTSYQANTKGDVFAGGSWTNAQNGSDWLQRDFDGLHNIAEIIIASAGTDVTTKGSRMVLKLQTERGQWITVDELRETNINLEKLSFGGIGNSVPTYRKVLSSPITAKAFRLEFYGNGWFSASDIKLIGNRIGSSSTPPPTSSSAKTQMGWELVKIVHYDTPPTDEKYILRYSEGEITWRWALNNDIFAFRSTWTKPPQTIRPNERVTMTFTVEVTENTGTQYSSNGSFSIWFDHPDIEPGLVNSPIGFTNERGESGGIEVSHNTPGRPRLTRTVWIDATKLPSGGQPGSQIALIVSAFNGRLAGTKYIYEWRQSQ